MAKFENDTQSQNTTNDRREFLKQAAVAVVALPLVGTALKAPAALAGEALPAGQKEVSEKDPVAMALGYHADASKVDNKKWAKHAGAEGKKQFCDNCSFYTKSNGSWGKCTMLASGLVTAKGWCNSWNKKA